VTGRQGAAAVGLVLVAGALLAFWRSVEVAPSAADVAKQATPSLQHARCTPGMAQAYALEYRSESRTRPVAGFGGELEQTPVVAGGLVLKGTWEVVCVASGEDGAQTALVRVPRCEAASLVVGEQVVWQSDEACTAALEGQSLLVRWNPDGVLQDLAAPTDELGLGGHVLHTLAMELQPGPREARALTVNVQSPHGLAVDLFESRGPKVLRTRASFASLNVEGLLAHRAAQRVDSRGASTWRDDGVLQTLEADERLEANEAQVTLLEVKTTLSLRWLGARLAQLPVVQGWAHFAPGQPPVSAQARQKALDQRADGLTMEDVLQTLRLYGNGGQVPDHRRFLWRATGLLGAHPELCAQLGDVFRDAGSNARARSLVMDLLSGTGHAAAQRVMVALLQSPIEAPPERQLLLQRLGLVDEPTLETAKFVEQAFTAPEAAPGDRMAAAYTLGSIVDGLDDTEHQPTADALNLSLVNALAQANTAKERADFIQALGNTEREDNVARIAAYATDTSADVRRAVAENLELPRTSRAEHALLSLCADADKLVQHEALAALKGYEPTAEQLETLTRLVQQGRLDPTNARVLLDLAKTRVASFPAAGRRLLEAVLGLNLSDGEVSAAAGLLLSQLP